MTALIVITGVLLLASGAIKLRAGERVGMGLQPLPLAELVFALIVFASVRTERAGLWLVPGGILLVLASSALFLSRMRAFQRRRAETEAGRLATYLKYFALGDEDSGDGRAL
jgi:hypothetical protein